MRNILLFLLGVLLIIDAGFALFLFAPQVLDKLQNRQITLQSEIPSIRPRLINKAYLDRKLSDRSFWKNNGVNYFTKEVERITVKKINLILTDKPQNWGKQLADRNGKSIVAVSYGQKYDLSSKSLTVYIHLDRKSLNGIPIDQYYSGYILYTLFDQTYKYPRNSKQYDAQLKEYMADFLKESESSKFIQF